MLGKRRWAPLVALATAALLGAGVMAAGPAGAADPDPTLTDAYDAVGTSHIGSIGTSIPLGPTTLTETLDLNNLNIVSGTLPLPSQQVQFKALGLVPVRATVSFVQAAPVTGALIPDSDGNDTIKASVAYTIKLSNLSAQVLGVWVPLFVGNNCQTVSPAKITVATPSGQFFDLFNGGTVTSKYTIGQFQNCAPLQFPDILGIGSIPVNVLVPGTNNTLTLNLSNGRYAGP